MRYALWRDANGRHQKRLGLVHVKDSGRRTPRGAIVWRAADGPKPDASHLSPAEADDELNKLLASSPREPTDPRHKRDQDRAFGEACDAWLDYVEHEKALRPSTVRDYRNASRPPALLPSAKPMGYRSPMSTCSDERSITHDGRASRSSRCRLATELRGDHLTFDSRFTSTR